jgi:hypothetical protein
LRPTKARRPWSLLSASKPPQKRPEKPGSNASLPRLGWFLYAARFTFAHLALCAAAIRLRPAAEIVRFGFGAWPFAFAQRAFCAGLILRRPAKASSTPAPA